MAKPPRATQPVEIDETTVEILPPRSNSNAIAAQRASVFTFGQQSSGFKPVAYVTTPMLEIPEGMSIVCLMFDKARVLPAIEGYNSKYKGDHIASTIQDSAGNARLFTWNTVFKSEMEKAYPNDAYVGKWFNITKLPTKRGKDYATFAIIEVELAAEAA